MSDSCKRKFSGDGIKVEKSCSTEIEEETPTPTRLLEAVDEAGVFSNPFDQHFRDANSKNKLNLKVPSSVANDELNTPKINTAEIAPEEEKRRRDPLASPSKPKKKCRLPPDTAIRRTFLSGRIFRTNFTPLPHGTNQTFERTSSFYQTGKSIL